MDKAEQVLALLRVGPLRDWGTTDARLDEIAALLRREYGDVRREALEEAWRTFCPECKARIPPKGRCGYVSESGGEQAIASLAICPLLRAAKEET